MDRERLGSGEGALVRRLLLMAWLGVVLLLTLIPVPGGRQRPQLVVSVCLFCGDSGLADAVLNTLMFAPLGLLGGLAPRVAFLVGVALSGSIEFAQQWVPGRYTNLGDVFWNGVGALLGAVGATWVRGALDRPRRTLILALATVTPVVYVSVAGRLLTPTAGDRPNITQWHPGDSHLERYLGRVLEAELGGEPLPMGRYRGSTDTNSPRSLEVRFVKGPVPSRLSPVIRSYDWAGRQIFMLGVSGEDLVWHERMVSSKVELGSTALYSIDALAAYAPGDEITVGIRREGDAVCIRVQRQEECGLGVTPGRTWTLLISYTRAERTLGVLFDALWMALLFAPLGLGSASIRLALPWALPAVVGALAATTWTGLLSGGWSEAVGAISGVVLGLASRPAVRAVVAPRRLGPPRKSDPEVAHVQTEAP